jgi:hypothetical protein
MFPFQHVCPSACALLHKEILLLDPSLRNFEHDNELIDDSNMANTHACDSTPIPSSDVLQGPVHFPACNGDNLSPNGAKNS